MGQQLGNYQLTRLLGQGSFAEVYLSEHVYLKTQAAIKVLHTPLSQADQKSFLDEARTIARLKHPHIVPVLECGVERSIPFLVMDYAPNGNLRQRYRKGTRLTPALILPYVKQVAAALQYAHNENVIHRDIKPENMLLGSDNEVLLSDFGIALGTQSSRSQNMQGVAGTAAYMAPELLQGRYCLASDQYGLAIVIYEWLSGDTPFHGSFAEIASQQVFVPPPSLEKVPAVSPAVEKVVMTALAKDPQQRFASMQALASAFEEASLLEEETVRGQPSWLARVSVPKEETIRAQQDEHSFPVTLNNVQDSRATQIMSDSGSPSSSSTRMLPETQPARREPLSRRGPSRSMSILLAALALLVITSGLGLAFYTTMLHSAQLRARATAAAQASLTAQTLQNMYTKATSGSPVLNDPLSKNDANNWDVKTIKGPGSCTFTGGTLRASTPHPYYSQSCIAEATKFSNFAFQVQMSIIKGDGGGLIFRANQAHTDTVTLYAFGINQGGSYVLLVISQGSTKILIQRPGSAIKAGLDQSNLLTVVAQGSRIYLYVNRQYVADVDDTTSISGKIGVIVYADPDPTEVAFSNAQVWNL